MSPSGCARRRRRVGWHRQSCRADRAATAGTPPTGPPARLRSQASRRTHVRIRTPYRHLLAPPGSVRHPGDLGSTGYTLIWSTVLYTRLWSMSSGRLTTTSYAVLAQVAVHPWSTYELAQQRVRYFRYVWPRAESAIYREVKRLSSMGLLEGKKEHVGKRARTIYSITEKGREALREWLATPVSPFAMDFEAMIRLFVAPLGTKDEIVATLELVLDDAREMLRFGGQVKQEFLEGMAVTQDQVYIRALAVDFFISLLNTVEAWAQRTLDEIESWDDLSPDGKHKRALEKLRELPVPTPGSIETTPIPPRTQRQRHRRA